MMFGDYWSHTFEEGRRPAKVIFLHLHCDYLRASFLRKCRERKWNGVKKGIQARACDSQEMNKETTVVNKPIILLKVIVRTACWDEQSVIRGKQQTRKRAGKSYVLCVFCSYCEPQKDRSAWINVQKKKVILINTSVKSLQNDFCKAGKFFFLCH